MQILAAAKAALYEFSLTDLTGVIAYNPKHFYAFNNTFYPHRTRNALSFQTQSYEGDLQWSHVGKYAYDNNSPTHSFCYPSYMPFLFCLPSVLLVGLPKKRTEKKRKIRNIKYWAIKKNKCTIMILRSLNLYKEVCFCLFMVTFAWYIIIYASNGTRMNECDEMLTLCCQPQED